RDCPLLGVLFGCRLQTPPQGFRRDHEVKPKHCPHHRHPSHRLPVLPSRRGRPITACCITPPICICRDGQNSHHSLNVPIPRPRQRRVEIIEVENELTLRRGKESEVRQMTIAARLYGDPRDGRGCEVMRHNRRGSPVEGKRRLRHPTHSHRHQFLNPHSVLALEDLHWIAVKVESRAEDRTCELSAQSSPLFAELLQCSCIHRRNAFRLCVVFNHLFEPH